jgi:exopolysaccharide biosynthesis WecB/TagA/CpsF family protein
MNDSERIPLDVGGTTLEFDTLALDEAVGTINRPTDEWRVVITPNLHHLDLLSRDRSLLPIYRRADLLLPDGWPVALLLQRLSNRKIRRVTGADMLEAVISGAGSGRALVLVGGDGAGSLESLSHRATANGWAVHLESAPPSEMADQVLRTGLARRVARAGRGGVVVLGLGAPKQERFSEELRAQPGSGFILCVGMAINFSAQQVRRAPRWVQAISAEWIHRILQEPKRLLPRYARDARSFAPIVLHNLRSRP